MHEKHYRSIVKGISYRILGTVTTIAISYCATGQVATALSIGLADVLIKIVIYYAHERVWTRISLGKAPQKVINYEI